MPKPVCVSCQRFFRPKKNDFPWIEGMPKENNAPPGNSEPEKWKPYKLWLSDLWECNGCGMQIVVGHGREPVSEPYKHTWAAANEHYKPRLQVNDC